MELIPAILLEAETIDSHKFSILTTQNIKNTSENKVKKLDSLADKLFKPNVPAKFTRKNSDPSKEKDNTKIQKVKSKPKEEVK